MQKTLDKICRLHYNLLYSLDIIIELKKLITSNVKRVIPKDP